MNLADQIAQYRPAAADSAAASGRYVEWGGAAHCAASIGGCPLRFVLSDDLTRLCGELAYSRGARQVACADLLRIPCRSLWVEWCNAPWEAALRQFGLRSDAAPLGGRRGALIAGSADGRRATLRTFWTHGEQALASSMEAFLDFDTPEGEEPEALDGFAGPAFRVCDGTRKQEDLLGRCVRFRYERNWARYYADARLGPVEERALLRHALGTVALDLPLLFAFLLLLASRSGLPREVQTLAQLNRARRKRGKPPLLDYIQVRAPILPGYSPAHGSDCGTLRRAPRLHHVRGHLVRRGSQLFWRVPHLRGNARFGSVRARTVTWTFDGVQPDARRPPAVPARMPPRAAVTAQIVGRSSGAP